MARNLQHRRFLVRPWGGRFTFVLVLAFVPSTSAPNTALAAKPAVRSTESPCGTKTLSDEALPSVSPSEMLSQLHRRLSALHAETLPGPRGQALLKSQQDRIIADALDVETFAQEVLRQSWTQATAADRQAWTESLGRMLHSKYRARLRDPHRFNLTLGVTRWQCRPSKTEPQVVAASVEAELKPKGGGEGRGTRLLLRLAPQGREWRIFDVAVGGTSLLLTWRGRFRSFYKDGGIASVRRQMTKLGERYKEGAER